MHNLGLIAAWVFGVPLVIYFMTRGWTPPRRPRDPKPWRTEQPIFRDEDELPSAAPSTDQVIAGFYERIAANAELTRAAAAADQASAVACRRCGRNHFAGCPDDEPDAGARAVNGRTGELAGYWSPRED